MEGFVVVTAVHFLQRTHFMLGIPGARSMKQWAWEPLKARLSQTSMLPSDSLGVCHVQNGNDLCECSISMVLEGFDKKDTVGWHKTTFTYFAYLNFTYSRGN